MEINRRSLFRILFILAILGGGVIEISQAKFADFDASQIREDIISGPLDSSDSIGQSFVATKPYLSSIKLFPITLKDSQMPATGYHLLIHLQDSHHADIAFKEFPLPSTAQDFDLDFSFPVQSDSLNKNYYLLIETDAPTNLVSLWGSSFNNYQYGDIYLNGSRLSYDISFWPYYKPPLTFWIEDTFDKSRGRFIELFAISVIFFSIGYLACFVLGCQSKNLVETSIYALGMGIAIPPILFFTMSLLGIRLTTQSVLIFLVILMILAGAKYVLDKRNHIIWRFPPLVDRKEAICLSILFVLAIFSRVSQINDLFVSNWIDGTIHQQFLTKIIEKQTVSPNIIYPKGFHANALFLSLVQSNSLSETMLIFSQWLSLISGLTYYLLARKLLRSPYALLSAGLYWFWAPFPAYLIAWARFPYLQGLTLLPVAVTVFLDSSLKTWSREAAAVLLLIGLGLTYYGSFLMFVAFVPPCLIYIYLIGKDSRFIKRFIGVGIALIPIMLILGFRLHSALESHILGQESTITLLDDLKHTFEISLTHGGWIVWILGILGLVLSLLLRQLKLGLLASWVFSIILFNFVQTMFGITVSSVANTIIFLSIPLTLFSGFIFRFLFITKNRIVNILGYLCIAITVLTGPYNISGIINPDTVLYRSPDQKAMIWITNNTSVGSVFLANSFLWVDVYAPSDGGAWIPYQTGRTMIYLKSAKEYESLDQVIRQKNIGYIYLGSAYGDLASFTINNPMLELVYNLEGIRIYRVNQHKYSISSDKLTLESMR
jgi:hypothetical protein